jgi:hypothetical protein
MAEIREAVREAGRLLRSLREILPARLARGSGWCGAESLKVALHIVREPGGLPSSIPTPA